MTWWDRRTRGTRIALVAFGLIGGMILAVYSVNIGFAERAFLLSWFFGIATYLSEGYAALTMGSAGIKAYLAYRTPTKGPTPSKDALIEATGGTLRGPAMEAIFDGLTYVSQFAVATLLLVFLLNGKLGPIAAIDQYGFGLLLAFLYYTSGAGLVGQLEKVVPRLVGPAEIPTDARQKGLSAQPVTASGTPAAGAAPSEPSGGTAPPPAT